MTQDEMEVQSWRYSGRAFFVLPLSSGHIAILQPNRQPYRIVDTWDLARTIGPSAENFQIQHQIRERVTLSKDVIDISAEDLDL